MVPAEQSGSSLTSAAHLPEPGQHRGDILSWLPPRGFGNGLAATAWAVLADLDRTQVYPVLFALADAGIAGHVATEQATDPESGRPVVVWRLRVDSHHHAHAEDVLMHALRHRTRRSGPHRRTE